MSQFLFIYRGGMPANTSPAEMQQQMGRWMTWLKDLVSGFSLVEAKDLEHATELSLGCPIFTYGGAVEVRPVAKM